MKNDEYLKFPFWFFFSRMMRLQFANCLLPISQSSSFQNHFLQSIRQYGTPLEVYERQPTKFKQMEGLTERQKETRMKFWEAEKIWDAQIRWQELSSRGVEIVLAHKEAVIHGHFTYDDGEHSKVMTRLRHFLKGSCCGNSCRHVSFLGFVLFHFSFLFANN